MPYVCIYDKFKANMAAFIVVLEKEKNDEKEQPLSIP